MLTPNLQLWQKSTARNNYASAWLFRPQGGIFSMSPQPGPVSFHSTWSRFDVSTYHSLTYEKTVWSTKSTTPPTSNSRNSDYWEVELSESEIVLIFKNWNLGLIATEPCKIYFGNERASEAMATIAAESMTTVSLPEFLSLTLRL